MSHKKLRPFIVKVSVLGYFPLAENIIESIKYKYFLTITYVIEINKELFL